MNYPSLAAVKLYLGKFFDGDPVAAIEPSLDRAVDMNAVYDEILHVITSSGLVPDEANLTQLHAAILALIGDANPEPPLHSLSVTQAGGALTITLAPRQTNFRSPTLADGSVVEEHVAAPLTLVVSNNSTLGATSGQAVILPIIEVRDIGAGAVRAGIVNAVGTNIDLSETNLVTTTAEGGNGGADSAGVIYTQVAVATPSPYRVVGYVVATNTAGAWGNPVLVQGVGGQVTAPVLSIGTSKSFNTTYYNTRPKKLYVTVTGSNAVINLYFGITAVVAGQTAADENLLAFSNVNAERLSLSFVVGPYESYRVNSSSANVHTWNERY